MVKVQDILRDKKTEVTMISPQTTVLEAAQLMNEMKIGSLLITRDGQLVGIFTERDVLMRVVAAQRDPAITSVSQVMTTELVVCNTETPMAEIRHIMKDKRIRHLPVINDQKQILGIISIGDLNAHQLNGQATQIQYLEQYLYGAS